MDNAVLDRVRKQAWFHRFPRALPLALFLLGMLATILFVINFESLDRAAREARLEAQADDIASELAYKAGENTVYLNAAASLFSTTDNVSRQDINDLIIDLGNQAGERGVLGVGWVRWMNASAVPAFQAEIREQTGNPDFTIHPIPGSPFTDMAVIAALAPDAAVNRKALGYDMYSERVRRAAMDAAIGSGRVAASGKVQLVQDADRGPSPGFLLYVPVFKRIGTGRQWSKGPLKGFVYSPIRANEFLAAALRRVPHDSITVRVFDGPAEPGNALAAAISEGETNATVTRTVVIANRTWTLQITSVDSVALSQVSRLTLLFGTLASLLALGASGYVAARAGEDREVLEWLSQQNAIRISLTRELNHRVKNTLANVLSIASLTRRRSSNIDEFADGLTGRIKALSATHDLLSSRDWRGAELRDVVTSELAPYLDPDDPHVDLDGPDVLLSPNDALSLGLALHELATNAAKYGALSTTTGHVAIKWQRTNDTVCEVDWRESGGPPVVPPSRRGFGLDLIEKIVAHELKASVELNFNPEGVHCRLYVTVRDPGTFTIREARSGAANEPAA